jgi:diaminohydroxyphosphoribosylaminopyrimidine deaminase/5-amino-6-(5-phosphoribosylamino)uracil reductase
MHDKFLSICFQLASQGETLAYPNPLVGCVITYQDKIIAQGFHREYGKPHAEPNAINSFLESQANSGIKLEDCNIYINLEPCSHHGKTPPCADLITKHGFKKLIYSSTDPNPLVAGKGAEAICLSGIEVLGSESLNDRTKQESTYLNRVFFHRLNYPFWLSCKIARDEKLSMISPPKHGSQWFTNEESRKRVHRLRSTHQLLITSVSTVLADNPSYNIRFSPETLELADIKDPDILILKNRNNFSSEDYRQLKIFQTQSPRRILEKKNNSDYHDFTELLTTLAQDGYTKTLIEAGPRLSLEFLKSGLVNEIIIYQKLTKENFEQLKHLDNFLDLAYEPFSDKVPALFKKFISDEMSLAFIANAEKFYLSIQFCYSDTDVPDLEIRLTGRTYRFHKT